MFEFLKNIEINIENKSEITDLIQTKYKELPLKMIIQEDIYIESKVLFILDAIFKINKEYISDYHTHMVGFFKNFNGLINNIS